jgi:predicted branched-subunit amino acid permease
MRQVPRTPYVADEDPAIFREGFKKGMTTVFGLGAWGLVVGVAMIKTNLTVFQALGMTLFVFAGSAQLASLPLIVLHAPIWVIFATALVVNLRFVIFSALLAPHFAHLRWYKRFILGYVAGDLSVALFLQRFPGDERKLGKVSYFAGLVLPNWLAWQIGSVIGILLGSQIPSQWGLGFAGTLAIVCVTVPLITNWAALLGVCVASVVAVLGIHWPYKLGVLAAVIAGMLVAMLANELMQRRRE